MRMPISTALPRPWLPFGLVGMVVLWSALGAYDAATWWLEAIPAMLGLPLVWWLWPRFAWSPLAVWAMSLHATVLLVGAHYTYALTPLGFWLQELFDFSRNHYDRIGHLAQGFFPAILAREVLRRQTPLQGGWLTFMVVCFCMALSACYELVEWWTALAIGAAADAFLATQGDPWDTQWDMFLALCGALVSQLFFARVHERQIGRLSALTIDTL